MFNLSLIRIASRSAALLIRAGGRFLTSIRRLSMIIFKTLSAYINTLFFAALPDTGEADMTLIVVGLLIAGLVLAGLVIWLRKKSEAHLGDDQEQNEEQKK